MSDQWYRNEEWTPQTEAEFNSRLARAGARKAQYLRIQGSLLAGTRPQAALELLGRCIALADDWTLAPAHQDAAFAHWRLGQLELALESLEKAIEQQRLFPAVGTEAPFDYCLLVAVNGCEERFDRVLELLDGMGSGMFPSMHWKAQAAAALILSRRGRREDARAAARQALQSGRIRVGWVPGHPAVGIVPEPNALSARLTEIANAAP